MAGKRPDSPSLAEPQEALGFYLDSLLTDLPPDEPPEKTLAEEKAILQPTSTEPAAAVGAAN